MARTAAKEAQAKSEVRRASRDDLLNKRPLRKTATIQSGDETLEVVFQSIGRKAYADLVEECSEEVEQPVLDEEGKPVLDEEGNPKTEAVDQIDEQKFFPRLIAASFADFDVPVEEVESWADEWNSIEFDELAMTAYEVNTKNLVSRQGKG